jgi:hypothetical protein
MTRKPVLPFLLVLVVQGTGVSRAQNDGPAFGGPDAVENRIFEDIETWDDFRQNLIDRYGLAVSMDYTGVLLTASETFSDDTGAGGIARVYGSLDLVNDLEIRASPCLREYVTVRFLPGSDRLRGLAGTAIQR